VTTVDVPGRPTGRGSRWTSRRCATVAVVALIVVGGGWRWATDLSVLSGYGDANGGPATIGKPVYVDTQLGPDVGATSAALTVDSVSPRIVENTSNSQVVLLVCERNGSQTGIGFQDSQLSDSCSRIVALHTPADLTLGFMTAQVIVQVTARQRGVLHIAGRRSRAAAGLEPLADYLASFGDVQVNTLPCQACGTPIEFWTPEPGEQIQVRCPDCGWSTTLSIDIR
jgi:hypothetical protein